MRVIIETQGSVRARGRARVRRALSRILRPLAGAAAVAPEREVTFVRTSRVRETVRSVLPEQLVENRLVRMMTVGFVAGAAHVAFACVNIVMGLLARSFWTLSVGVFVAALNLGKSYLASGALVGGARGAAESTEALRRCRNAGIALALLNVVMSGTVARLVISGPGYAYPRALINVYAVYAFVIVVLAVVNQVRARREQHLSVKGVRIFNLSNALISIFALQTALLSGVGWDSLPVMITRKAAESAVGGIVCLAMIAMGLWLARAASSRLAARLHGARMGRVGSARGARRGTRRRARQKRIATPR